MSKNDNKEFSGKAGGHVVHSVIAEVEQEMAAGKHISAAPSSQAEAELLKNVKQENKNSGNKAIN